jgi:hypothetical protein
MYLFGVLPVVGRLAMLSQLALPLRARHHV